MGAGAARTYAQQAALGRCDRAAAGSDRPHVDPGRLQRHADDLALVLDTWPALDEEARVETGASDVRGDGERKAELCA